MDPGAEADDGNEVKVNMAYRWGRAYWMRDINIETPRSKAGTKVFSEFTSLERNEKF
jgi:hypothetical protein